MTNKNIYPYVYRLDHPVTGEFYIGSRSANVKLKLPAHLDLGIKYKTSSKYVEPRFHEFNYIIVAEFFAASDAYDFEQELIHASLGLPRMLNRACHHDNQTRFSVAGTPKTPEHRAKLRAARTGTKQSPETSAKKSVMLKGKNTGPQSLEHRANIGEAKKGTKYGPQTPEHSVKISVTKKGVKQSPDHIANHATSIKGTKQTPEHIAKKKGLRVYTDGASRKMFRPGSEPDGWIQPRLRSTFV